MPKKKSQDKDNVKGILYPKFLAEFTQYVKENNIKFKQKGRGQLYKEAGKLYRKSKNTPNFESTYKSVIAKNYSTLKPSKSKSTYNQFLSVFSLYVRENDISFKGKGRGAFFKQAGGIYQKLKNQPRFIENLDVILPQFVEPKKPKQPKKKKIDQKERYEQFLEKFAAQQFEYWLIKSLYGLWIQFKLTDPAKDKLIIKNIDGGFVDISNQFNTAALYKQLSAEVDAKELEAYSYLGFEDLVPNDKDGLDLIFSLKQSDIQLIRVKEETDFKWREDVKEKYFPDITEPKKPKEIKELVKVKKPVEVEKEPPSSIQLEKIKLETESKLKAFQLELDKLEKLLRDKVITYEQYESSSEKIAKRYGFQI